MATQINIHGTMPELDLQEPIQDALIDALDDSFSVKGDYAVCHQYDSGPLPGLHATGVGVIGLPLSAHDSERLSTIRRDIRVPNGVSPNTKGGCEYDPLKFEFANPGWSRWLRETVLARALSSLGVYFHSSSIRLSLCKVLLSECRSISRFIQSDDTGTPAFATLVIILPAQFTGGNVNVHNGSDQKSFDMAKNGAFSTTALACGRHISFSYHIIHTSPNPPVFPTDSGASKVLRILRSWIVALQIGAEYDDEVPPQKVIYFLQNAYTKPGRKSKPLQDHDAAVASLLRQVCKEAGFRYYLAHFECSISGEPDSGIYKRSRDDWREDYDVDPDTDNLEMDEIEDRFCCAHLVITDEGEPLQNRTEIDMADLPFADDYFDDEEPDDKEYEYDTRERGQLTHNYYRSVLFIFPDSNHASIINSFGASLPVMDALRKSNSPKSTWEERGFVDVCLAERSVEADRVVIDAALRWKDETIFLKAARSDRVDEVLDRPRIELCFDFFGFQTAAELVNNAFTRSSKNKRVLDLISMFAIFYSTDEARVQALKEALRLPPPNNNLTMDRLLGIGTDPSRPIRQSPSKTKVRPVAPQARSSSNGGC
ncbi:hypothetical protein BD410DRAFT_829295 [Rickenella mellea]|uniref:Uncharacterized protein n=1 Tax=Rickenella mellea TaxID=50990 RepID=A0A4Y7Q1R7_9AGAM|nr:hypothetical protein BD410DRAFT_829295 [Rickenella mellea]